MNTQDCDISIVGAGPYGLSLASYLRYAGVEARVFGEPMSFWQRQMPVGMFLRSNWAASHIADPEQKLTLDAYCRQRGKQIGKPVPIEQFVEYGLWFQEQAVPNVERRKVIMIQPVSRGFKLTLADDEEFVSRRVVIAMGIEMFAKRPYVLSHLPRTLASHSSEHRTLEEFKGKRVIVIGGGQSALESAALLHEIGTDVEVVARTSTLNWVGLHPKLHHLGLLSSALYSKRDVGPAGISRLVAMPHLFRCLPRKFQDRMAYRAIRPAVAGWLQPRLKQFPITIGRNVVSATRVDGQVMLDLDDGTRRTVDHALLATGFQVDVSKYKVLREELAGQVESVGGYPVLKRGMESSVPGLHFIGKPAAWSFGPLLGFVSGAEFASTEIVRFVTSKTGN